LIYYFFSSSHQGYDPVAFVAWAEELAPLLVSVEDSKKIKAVFEEYGVCIATWHFC